MAAAVKGFGGRRMIEFGCAAGQKDQHVLGHRKSLDSMIAMVTARHRMGMATTARLAESSAKGTRDALPLFLEEPAGR